MLCFLKLYHKRAAMANTLSGFSGDASDSRPAQRARNGGLSARAIRAPQTFQAGTKKALPDLAKAIENQKAVESVRVSIVLKKPKPSKAPKVDDK